jgi:8-oxo-dGTP pyrophosphatase MutT (NUDIX family)
MDYKTDDKSDEFLMKRKNKDFFCKNCGKKGHVYRKCILPIISLGIICLRSDNYDIFENMSKIINNDNRRELMSFEDFTNINMLMVRRRNSYAYVEFIRGKYDFKNLPYLMKLLSSMTSSEKNLIKDSTFDELWRDLWCINDKRFVNRTHNIRAHETEYLQSKFKFNMLLTGTYVESGRIQINISFDTLFSNIMNKEDNFYNFTNETIPEWNEPEWGFPKGRRNIKEENLTCAKREFREETNLNDNNYKLLPMATIEECYLGSNHLRYKHIYHIAESNDDVDLSICQLNYNQVFEIGAMEWMSYKQVISHLREHDLERKQLVTNLFHLLYIMLVLPSPPPGFEHKIKNYSDYEYDMTQSKGYAYKSTYVSTSSPKYRSNKSNKQLENISSKESYDKKKLVHGMYHILNDNDSDSDSDTSNISEDVKTYVTKTNKTNNEIAEKNNEIAEKNNEIAEKSNST